MNCDTMSQCDANDIIMYLTTKIELSATPLLYFRVFYTPHLVIVVCDVRTKQYY